MSLLEICGNRLAKVQDGLWSSGNVFKNLQGKACFLT